MDKPISEQLKEARKEKGLTILKVSELSGLTWDTVWRIEKNKNAHTYVHTLQQIQKALNIKFIL